MELNGSNGARTTDGPHAGAFAISRALNPALQPITSCGIMSPFRGRALATDYSDSQSWSAAGPQHL